MASVTLDELWLNLVSDPSQSLVIVRASSSTSPQQVLGQVRTYANGRQRVVNRAGRPGQTTVQARTTDLALIDKLMSWAGQPVWVRDERGRRHTGVYFEVPQTDDVSGWVEYSLTIVHTTHDESV